MFELFVTPTISLFCVLFSAYVSALFGENLERQRDASETYAFRLAMVVFVWLYYVSYIILTFVYHLLQG